MLRNFRRLLCLFVDISITPLTRRKVECKFGARVRDPSRALRDFMRLSGHFPLESLTAFAFFQSHQKQIKIRRTILDISSLRAGSDLYGEPYGELCEPHENARASGVPFPFRVLLSRDSSQLPLGCEEALHLGEGETSSLVCHSSVDFSHYFLNGELAGRLGLFF